MRVWLLILCSVLYSLSLFAADTFSNKMTSGNKTVTTTGTAVQVSSTSVGIKGVLVTELRAASHDSGQVYVGDSSVSAGRTAAGVTTPTNRKGIRLTSSDAVFIPITDLSLLYVDALTQDGVSFIYFQ